MHLKSPALRDALVALLFALAAYSIAVTFDLYHYLHELIHHEDWELEIILALLVAGVSGFIYAGRRLRDLRREIHRRNNAEDQANWLAFHDSLTRLPNRRYAEAQFRSGKGPAEEVRTAFSIDLDALKKVNDLVGHRGGDDLLIEMADRLRATVGDATVVRMGGDEFVVISAVQPGEPARTFAEEMLGAISTPMVLSGIEVQVGASIGIAHLPEHAADVRNLLKLADLAMHAAKNSGRNRICVFREEMRESLAQRVQMEAALRHAIRNDLIEPHYQPLIHLHTGAVHGFEALARWTSEDGKAISPLEFISVAEESGLISDLSHHLFRRACRDALEWPKDLKLAFNISATQLTDRLLALRILRILCETGLPPHRLEIEITESAIVRELDAATAVIGELRSAGVRIALDDFGTGYSSLSQLSSMAFDKIKIDRSFIANFESSDKKMKIVKAIIGLGHGLGITTTAEGVEEQSQLEELRALGCDLGQGFLFAKAMPASQVNAFLKSTHQNSAEAKRVRTL